MAGRRPERLLGTMPSNDRNGLITGHSSGNPIERQFFDFLSGRSATETDVRQRTFNLCRPPGWRNPYFFLPRTAHDCLSGDLDQEALLKVRFRFWSG